MKEFQCCTRCILDTTVSDIWFDSAGVCKYCNINDEMEKTHPLGKEGQEKLELIIQKDIQVIAGSTISPGQVP